MIIFGAPFLIVTIVVVAICTADSSNDISLDLGRVTKKGWTNTVPICGSEIHAVISHGPLRSVIDLMLYWRRHTAVFLIESYTGMQPNHLTKYVRDLLKDDSKVIFIDQDTQLLDILSLEFFERYLNFVVICGHTRTTDILAKAKSSSMFQSNRTWIIVDQNISSIPPDTFVSANTQITTVAGGLFQKNFYDVFFSEESNRVEHVKFANWSITTGLLFFEEFEQGDGDERLRGRMLRSVGFKHMPYVRVTGGENNTSHFSGFSMEALTIVMEGDLKANLSGRSSVVAAFGSLVNGTFTGITGALQRRESDIGINCIGMNTIREKVLRYIIPMNFFGMMLMYETPKAYIPMTTHWLPFPTSVWLLVLALLLVTIACLATIYGCSRQYRGSDRYDGLASTKFYILSWTFFVEVLENPIGKPAKIAYLTLLLSVMFTFQMYSAELFSFLSNQDIKYPLKTLDDVSNQNKYRPVFVKNTAHVDIVKNSKRGDYRRIWHSALKSANVSLQPTPMSGIRQVFKGKYALISDEISFRAEIDDQCSAVSFRLEPDVKEYFCMITRLDFPYSRLVYKRMLRLYSGGVIVRLRLKYNIKSKWICAHERSNISFGIKQVLLPFFVLLAGIVLALLALIIENVI